MRLRYVILTQPPPFMKSNIQLAAFAPPFEKDTYTIGEYERAAPFFTNLDQSVYAPLIFSPEVIGALCSRTSRAAQDLRLIFLNEYVSPFLDATRTTESDEEWESKEVHGRHLREFINFLQEHPLEQIFSNPRARSFYAKWLAQYGDDSIAQMAGMHVVFSSLSQLGIKHFEDQRIGLAPIEKSTRYVDYSSKVQGKFRYYRDPTLADLGLDKEYEVAMDGLFLAYTSLLPRLSAWLTAQFPEEKAGVVEKKAFDTLRGLLPCSTLSQVAFFGNGQAFEYLVSRSAKHPLGEVRWAGERTYQELYKITPSFLRRVKDPDSADAVGKYQEYLSGKNDRVAPLAAQLQHGVASSAAPVTLVEYDPLGEEKVITGMLYSATNNHQSWAALQNRVQVMSNAEKNSILDAYFSGRDQRWQKTGRALENAYVRFEIVMNIGAWRDLHRHRMLTQQRQIFTCSNGFDTPPELVTAGLDGEFRAAIERAEAVHSKIAQHDLVLAQYAVTMAHRVRFMQWENLRECFWEIELRTIPEGHPDYRRIEQEKFRLLERVYPLLMQRMRVNMGDYDFARRGQEEKIQEKLRQLQNLSAV